MRHVPSPTESRHGRVALAALLVGSIFIACSPIFVRLSEVGPMATAFWRVGLAFLPFALAAQMIRPAETARPQTWREHALLALPGIFLAVDLAAWHLSLHKTSVANATLFANLAPIFVTLGSWLLFRIRVSRIFLAGLFTALVGMVTLKGGPAALGDGHLAGDALAVLAAAFYAGYILTVGRLRGRYSTLTIMTWSTGAATLCMTPLVLITEPTLLPLTLFGWAVVIGLALISHVGGQSMIAYALAFLPPAFSSLTLLLQPVVAALLAYFLLDEPVGALQAIGGVIVLAGITIARRG